MKYWDYLINILKSNCPFCDINKNFIVDKSKDFLVVLARAPYIKDHLLIIPKRHIVRLWEIRTDEWSTLIPLIDKRMKKLEKIHDEVNLLLRDWDADWVIWKSIDHLHFHLVPDVPLYYWAAWWRERKVFSDFQLGKMTKEFKQNYRNK